MAQILSGLRRPRLLVTAARLGVTEYRRGRDLRRLVASETLPRPAEAVAHLLLAEAEIEETRRQGAVTYRPSRHVATLAALIAEAQLCLEAEDAPRPVA